MMLRQLLWASGWAGGSEPAFVGPTPIVTPAAILLGLIASTYAICRQSAWPSHRVFRIVGLCTLGCLALGWLLSNERVIHYSAVVAFANVTAWRWVERRRSVLLRRRFHEGRCIRCGYNLSGNVSGVCPECGRATESLGKEKCDTGP